MIKKSILKLAGLLIVVIVLSFVIKSCFFFPYYDYEPFGNGYAITNCNNSTEIMTFPAQYKKKPIVKIGPLVFMLLKFTKEANSIRILRIPDSVEIIAHEAFFGADKLEECYVGKNVREIGDTAFYKCSKLIQVYLPSSVKFISKTAFEGCTKLTLFAPAGSYAEKFARENNIPFKIIFDINFRNN